MQLQVIIIIALTGMVGFAAICCLVYDIVINWWRNRH